MFRTLLPPNSTKLERDLETSMAKAYDLPVAIDTLWHPENCPLELLPFLAWALSIDVWSSDWPEPVKRNVIASSVFVHRHKGTAAGIKSALAALDLGVELSEWFEHGGDPYTFKVDVMISTRGLTDREFQDIVDIIARTKNARSHLSNLRVYITTQSTAYFASASVLGERIDVQPWVGHLPIASPVLHLAVATHIAETISTGANLV